MGDSHGEEWRTMVGQKEFELRKEVVLQALASEDKDKSRKGCVDGPIAELINRINSHPSFFTTSSCSGRVSIFLEQSSSAQLVSDPYHNTEDICQEKAIVKKGGDWIYVSHEPVEADNVVNTVKRLYQEVNKEGLLVFRFEPFILALECCSLAAAQQLLTCAMASGYRESGISSTGKRIILAVRSSIRLEVPIGEKGQLVISEEYLRYLTAGANKKFVLNQQRINRFLSTFIEQIDNQIVIKRSGESLKTVCPKARHRRLKGMTSVVQDKLFSSIEKRQLNILLKISNLEARTGLVHCPLKDEKSSSAEGLAQSDMCSLCAASPIVSSGLLEKLLRWGHSACATGKHSVIIFGGYGGPERHARLNDVLELDVSKGCIHPVRPSGTPAAVMAHTATRVAESMIVIGGRKSPTCILGTVSVLDLKTLNWNFPRVTGAEFPPRHRHAVAVVDSKIYVYGGLNDLDVLHDLHVLDTASWTWSRIDCQGKLPSPRHSHSLAAIGSKLYLFGGREGNAVHGDLHILDLETYLWSQENIHGVPPSPRFSHTMTAVNHYIAIIGGCPITKQGSDLVFLDTANMSWVRVKTSWPNDSLLVRHSTTLVGDSLVVVGGGAACFAFGTTFSPTFVLNLKPFIYHAPHPENHNQAKIEPLKELLCKVNRTRNQDLGGWVLKVKKTKAKVCKDALKYLKWLDPSRKSEVLDQNTHVAFPIIEGAVPFLQFSEPVEEVDFFQNSAAVIEVDKCRTDEALGRLLASEVEFLKLEMSVDSKHHCSPQDELKKSVSAFLEHNCVDLSLLEELPKRWERLGDMVVLPSRSFCSLAWSSLGEELWKTVMISLGANRLARQAPIASTGTRDSQLQLLYGLDGWVQHRENGILYCFDATKCMFSSGNISEKLRMAKIQCRGATVVDLFAGIGYYVLPFLLKAGVKKVYACEWNPHALVALRHNLLVNGVEDKCEVIEGDNRITAPQGVAEFVVLGLLPTSESSWAVAIRALRPEGGILFVHENVKDTEEKAWIGYLLMSMSTLAASLGRTWDITVVHLERVKWYAPHIRHVVADVCCKPTDISWVSSAKGT